MMDQAEIRRIFYDYFIKKKHRRVPSSPLIPAKDPSLLFTNAGMNQFKGVFLQEEKRDYRRAVSIQKCMRVSGKHNDFDEVGKTDFHHTFFEMLGNFSFGDYFKEKAIAYAWELLTSHFHLPPERLWITVYQKDDEAFRIWQDRIGVPENKIIRLGDKDNFWQMGETGPCGPCSEIHYDRGAEFGTAGFSDGNRRYVEIWNLVFMQYFRNESGSLLPLPAPAIDTGMGMERLSAVLQDVPSNYRTDLFRPLVEYTAELAGVDPDRPEAQVDLNVIADHIRALTFLIADGIMPANDGRGYVLRRLLRRAVKHGKALNFKGNFLNQISSRVIAVMKPFYPELEHNQDFIRKVITVEEDRFNRTLVNGLKIFEELLQTASEKKLPLLSGSDLFRLSDTYGFPLDFARDLAMEKGIGVDLEAFQQEMKNQKDRSRLSLQQKRKEISTLKDSERWTSEFSGYDELQSEASLLAVYVDGKQAQHINEGEKGILIFNRSPFYAESGGQVGDSGSGKNDRAYFTVSDTKKTPAGAIVHQVEMQKGGLRVGDTVWLQVDEARRRHIAVHHTSTHMLHAALREVLGLHVKQAGSRVGPDKLRFDFTHFNALNADELEKVEAAVNEKIRENIAIAKQVQGYEEAVASGAIAIFDEKYGDTVRVIAMGDFSRELCGGTHLQASGEIGFFKILSEASIASGVRRIEAVAGEAAFIHQQKTFLLFNQILGHFGQKAETLLDFLKSMELRLKEKEKQAKKEPPALPIEDMLGQALTVKHAKAVIAGVKTADRQQLGDMAEAIKNRLQGIAVLFANVDGKSIVVASVFKDLTADFNANIIIKKIAPMINGKGGGRNDFAQAGGDAIVQPDDFKAMISRLLNENHDA
ncbi:MAG TPA: alanine--tRNA ligase [Candidatus Binatia bacterium]|nr:alanine--tRNA ligase [Candidatus Binatia bacterium]